LTIYESNRHHLEQDFLAEKKETLNNRPPIFFLTRLNN
jgi:hypothetical protein